MSIAIIGGLDRLRRSYEKERRNRGFDASVFSPHIPNMARRMNGVQRILIFTGTVAHSGQFYIINLRKSLIFL